MKLFFSDAFAVSPKLLEDYGAFDVSLINDLPLFIDPFLLFNSSNPEYVKLHDEIITYLKFLESKSRAGPVSAGLRKAWFTFPEVKQTWFGYSLQGNGGTGLGDKFAVALSRSFAQFSAPLGDDTITKGSHLEKIVLIGGGVGRDNISDFSTNLIKPYLLEYTQTFARKYIKPEQRRVYAVPKTRFNYSTETWRTERFELPHFEGAFVILTPIDMLTKDDVWINRSDLLSEFETIASSVPNTQLRDQINNYFVRKLSNVQRRDFIPRPPAKSKKKGSRVQSNESPPPPTKRQLDESALDTILKFPAIIDYFIRWKEEHGDEAEAQADERVRSSERLYINQVRQLVSALANQTTFYRTRGNTLDEARERVEFLKDVIENKGGHRLFYVDGEPVRREPDIHIMFRLTWCTTISDVNREVNNGRGPSDFEASRGRFDKSLVEFKLAKSSSLARNLRAQAEIYKKASDAQHALKVIIYFTAEERNRVIAILKTLKMEKDKNIILIDARSDNKPSASTADIEDEFEDQIVDDAE